MLAPSRSAEKPVHNMTPRSAQPHRHHNLTLVCGFVIAAAISGCKAEPQQKLPQPLPEAKLALPEYFGFYAVDRSKTIRLPDKGEWRAENLSSTTEFILFEENAADKTSKAFMRAQTFEPAISLWQDGKPSLKWNQHEVEKVPGGAPKGFKIMASSGIELLRKPVANQPAMIRLVPATKPQPGFHTVEFGDHAFAVWIDRDLFDKEVADATYEVKTALADPLLSQQLEALRIIEKLKAARARKLPSEDMRALAGLGKQEEFEVLLTHPTSVTINPRPFGFEGMYLFCEHCKKGFKVRKALQRSVKKSTVVPCTYYLSDITCSQCMKVTKAEFAFLHGL